MLLASPGDGAVPLRWQASYGAESYTVKRATVAGGPYAIIASAVTGTSHTDDSVTNGKTYYYTVTATSSAGTSGSSPVDSATPAHPMLNVVGGGTATDRANDATSAGSAFDLNSATQWFHKGVTGWLQYDIGDGQAQAVERYSVTSSGDKVPRDPKDWQLRGSDDGDTWTTLDTQTHQSFSDRYQINTYSVATPAPYRYYRLDITANNGDSTFTDLAEVGLFTSAP